MEISKEAKWYLLLFLALGLFAINLFFKNLVINLGIIILAGIIHHYGNPILFKAYNERQKQKIKDSKKIREATKVALTSGKIFKR